MTFMANRWVDMMSVNLLRAVIARNNWVVLDTETTGLGSTAEIVQLAVVDRTGKVLIDTLLRPTKPIPADATRIHGITNAHVAAAPRFNSPHVLPALLTAIGERDVVVYNASYDLRLLYQTSRAYALRYDWQTIAAGWTCAMLAYAEFYGEWNAYYRSPKWQKLSRACEQQGIPVHHAHSALADCKMTWALVKTLVDARQCAPYLL